MMEDAASPFTTDILAEEFARDFLLPRIPAYDGKTDPLCHIQQYQMWMKVGRHSMAIMCQAFCLTLSGPAYQWFLKLRPGTIRSFEELQQNFLARFGGSRERKLGKSHLRTVRQRRSESLREYLSRFTEESNRVDKFEDGDAISAILDGLLLGDFLNSLIKKEPKTMTELTARAGKYITLEEFVQIRRTSDQGNRRREDEESDDWKRKKARADNSGRPHANSKSLLVEKFRDHSNFTPLNAPPERILVLAREKFRAPEPLKTEPGKRNRSKYCEFHKDHGHSTSECFHLKRQIEALIQQGELKEFVLDMINNARASTSQRNATANGAAHDRNNRAATPLNIIN